MIPSGTPCGAKVSITPMKLRAVTGCFISGFLKGHADALQPARNVAPQPYGLVPTIHPPPKHP